jgi:hypothetical protein
MIWNNEHARFSWLFIILVVYSTLFLVGFDLTWRLVEIGIAELVIYSGIAWCVGASVVYFTCRKL